MDGFWNNIILPVIEAVNAQYIVEIGSGNGVKTENILEYCLDHNARMIAMDPFPNFNVSEYKKYGNIFEFYPEITLNRLPLLKNFDIIIIDGNHKWFLIYNELKIIEENFQEKYPIIFFTNIHDNKPHRVLTAIEEFINESDLNFSFKLIKRFSGLGILYIKNNKIENIINKVSKSVDLIDILEDERIKSEINLNESKIRNNTLKNEYNKYKTELKPLKIRLNDVKSKLNHAETQLNSKEIQLNNTEAMLINIGSRLDHSKKKLNSSDVQIMMKQNDDQVEQLYTNMDFIKNRYYEIKYLDNYNRSIFQRFVSKFPSIYFLLKMDKSGIKKALINIKGYKAIKKYNLFDLGYYLKSNVDVRSSGADPILHYLYRGFKEGRRPHPEFDSDYYLKSYSDVQKSGLNPLIHYSLYGIDEGRRINNKNVKNNLIERLHLEIKEHSENQINSIMNTLNSNKVISIIIPIFNNYENTKSCIDSVMKYTKIPYQLILLDDYSTDKRIQSLLKGMDKQSNIKIIFNQNPVGYIKNINTGIKHSDGDVVILDSNTVVTSRWLQKLVVASYSDERIGMVSPFSNDAGFFSVPEIGKKNELPIFLTLNGMSSLVEKISTNINVEVATANGICIFIKRATIDDVGLFNEEELEFSEDNDFFKRAMEASWKYILDDSTYIYHNGDKISNEKHEKDRLVEEQSTILDQKHIADIGGVADFSVSVKLSKIHDNITKQLDNLDYNRINYLNKKRILYIFSQKENVTPKTKDLLINIQKTFECYILTSTSKELLLWKYSNNKIKQVKSWKIEWSQTDIYSDKFRDLYFNILTSLKIDIIHILDLFKHTFDLSETAHKLGLPIILSINNDYLFKSVDMNNPLDSNVLNNNKDSDNDIITSAEVINDQSTLSPSNDDWESGVLNIIKNSSKLFTTPQLAVQINSFHPDLELNQFKLIENNCIKNQNNHTELDYTKEMSYEFETTYCENLFIDKNSQVNEIYRVAIFVRGRNGHYPPTANIRLLLPFYHPTLYGKVVPHIIDENFIDNIDINSFLDEKTYDCIIVQRDILELPFAKFLVKKCQELDIKLIYELDDDLLGIDETHPEYLKYTSKGQVIKYLIENADIVTVSTFNLKESLDDMADVRLISNALDERLWCTKNYHPPNENNVIKIGYMGSFTHGKDLIIIKNVINDLKMKYAKNGIDLIFEIIGGIANNETDNWFHQIPIPSKKHSYPLFVEWLKNAINWDVAIAPLTDVPLNNSKSEIKYLEYTGLGLSAVYSDVGPYHGSIKNGYNGLLVKNNDIYEWEDQIKRLISDKKLCKKIKYNARKNIGKEYLIKYRTGKWYDIIKELVDSN